MIKLEDIEESDVILILNWMQENQYIKILNNNNVILRAKLLPEKEEVSWIEEYRALFKGKKSGVLGTKDVCIKYMNEFISKHPQYTKEHILKATQMYIESCKNDGYKFLQQADYFIQKYTDATKSSRQSRLLQWCEELESNGDKIIGGTMDYGESI